MFVNGSQDPAVASTHAGPSASMDGVDVHRPIAMPASRIQGAGPMQASGRAHCFLWPEPMVFVPTSRHWVLLGASGLSLDAVEAVMGGQSNALHPSPGPHRDVSLLIDGQAQPPGSLRLLGDGLLEVLSPGGVGRRRVQLVVAGRATFGAVLASAPPRLHGVASLEAELPDLAASLDASSRSDPTYEASVPETWGGIGAWDPAMRCSRVVLLGFDLGEQSDYDQGRASALSNADSNVACEYVTRAESFRLVCCTRVRQGRMQVRAAGHVGELSWSWAELVHRPRVTAAAPSLLSTAGGQRLAIGGEGLRASSTGAYVGNRSVHYRGSQSMVLAGPLGTVAAGFDGSDGDRSAAMQAGRVTAFRARDPPALPVLGNLGQLLQGPPPVLGDVNMTDVHILTGPALSRPV